MSESAIVAGTIDNPLFVLGTQRSGTTLLCRMLTAHSRLFIHNELDVRRIFTGSPDGSTILARIRALAEAAQTTSTDQTRSAAGKELWGLKDPELTDWLDVLRDRVPGARFVIIVRDPRAVVRSYLENAWGLGTNAYTGALRWARETDTQRGFAERCPDSVHLLRYEDLVVDPPTQLVALCAFLGIGFEQAMLAHEQSSLHFNVNRENRASTGRLDPALASRWRDGLTIRQRRLIVGVCERRMAELGYVADDAPLRPWAATRVAYRMHQAVIGEVQIQYRWRTARWRARREAAAPKA